MQTSTIITTDSEREAHLYWQVAAEYRAAIQIGNTAAAALALDEIEGFARCSERGSMRRIAGAMLDRNRPGWRAAAEKGQDETGAAGPLYCERDLGDGMVEIRAILPRIAKRGLFRAFCVAADPSNSAP